MEVEEEIKSNSNHLEESMAEETTTNLFNQTLLENTTSTDTKLISESNTREENSSVSVLKSEDSDAVVAAAVGESEEVVVNCRNSESVAALSGGIENSVVVESMNEVEGVKEIGVPSDDVAAAECGGSELTCSVAVERNGDLEVVVEDTKVGDFSVIEKDDDVKDGEEIDPVAHNGEGYEVTDINVQSEDVENVQEVVGFDVRNDYIDETMTEEPVVAETVKEDDEKETVKLKEGEESDVLLVPVAHNGEGDEVTDQLLNEEDVESVQKMVGFDVRNDGADAQVENTDETMTEEPVVAEIVKAEDMVADVRNDGGDMQLENIDDVPRDEAITEVPVVAEAVKEEEIVADEEEVGGVKEDFKEEVLMINEETTDAVAENDEEETEKSLDIEMDTEKSLDTDLETDKSLDTEMENEEEANLADEDPVQETEIETEPDMPESSKKGSGGKRKRGGKITKTTPKSSAAPRKTIEEDVCFICFDGGNLVLCDRRNCPKAYHPSCVNRDEAFFQSKGRWNCGWHMCSICEKKAEYMCYTCTYSLCKACTKTSVILCVREKEKKGLCEACMKTVMLIEKHENQVNFDDKNSWEHLFKDYWIDTKAKHNLSLSELSQAKNPNKGSGKQDSQITQSDVKDDGGLGPETRNNKRKSKKQKSTIKEDEVAAGSEGLVPENTELVSKELLEFVTHMKNGDSSVISQYEVQDLLLEYIKRNKLRDPNRKSQIICDARLENLFGKPRVAHIEMLKLLESHYLTKDYSQIDNIQGTVVDDDETNETLEKDHKDKKRKGRKKGDRRGPQSNREDYAAIDIHNISLIYLRRKLVEDLLDDMERFHEKIFGTFVRIRISGANQKQDIYRLVQVTGTSEAAQYTLGKRKTCTMLEILNLDKTETISIDTISNQEFTEDECKRLRQSIKCGLISRLTVGDILDKAMELQVARVNDWLETEVVRLSHLRDRASDLGRKKELRECVEKLNVLKTPEERARRLEEFPFIHDDPTMDPDYGSEDDSDSDDKKQESYKRSDSFRFNKSGTTNQFAPSPRGDYTSRESWSGTPRTNSSKNYEFTRNLSNKNISTKPEDATENSRDQKRDPFVQEPITLEKPTFTTHVLETSVAPSSTPNVNETEKMWHYKDPSKKIQGPFSMVQLRKWSKNGYFPVGLKIWRKSDKEDDGILLSDALEGKFDQKKASQDRLDFINLPSPTPNKPGPHTGGSEGLQSPTPSSSVHLGGPAGSSLVPCVNKDVNDSSNSVSVAVAPQNVDQGQLGQQVGLPDSNMGQQMVQSVSGQNPQGWSQNLQANPSMNMAGLQPLGFNQWGGVPNMVQNPAGNYMAPTQEPWGQFPFPVNQPNMQQPQPPNVNWATMAPNPNMGWVGPSPGNPMNWGPMVQDPNWGMQTGWVPQPPVQGVVQNQNWVAAPIQGPIVAGNGTPNPNPSPNPSWVGVGPVGNQVAPNAAGWGAPTVNPNQVPVNPNPNPNPNPNLNTGWVGGPPVNQGAPVANQGPWVQPTGNQGPPPGSTNQNWGSPTTRNHGNWGGNDNRGSFSGQRRNRGSGFRGNNRRNFNRQESFHKDDN